MSVYDIIQQISNITTVQHTIKPDKLIAKFYLNNNVINYYFREYNEQIFKKHLSFNYDHVQVCYQFWDPSLCDADMLMPEDISYFKTLNVFKSDISPNAAAGFVLSLIGLYNIILKSYNVGDFNNLVDSISFDKSILRKVFVHIDIVANFSDSMLLFTRNLFKDNLLDIMVTPTNQFRFTVSDIEVMVKDTILVHEISSLVDKYVRDDITKLYYYIEILQVCGNIETPYDICDFTDENIMLNICKLNLDIEQHYALINKAVSMYFDKGGTVITIHLPNDNKYPMFGILYRTFKNFHLKSSEDMF